MSVSHSACSTALKIQVAPVNMFFLLYMCMIIFTLKRRVLISWSRISNLVVVCFNIWRGGNIISLHGRLNLSERNLMSDFTANYVPNLRC